LRAHQAVIREVEKNRKFASRVRDSSQRVLAFKKKVIVRKPKIARPAPVPTSARVDKLTSQLWEFGEEIRLTMIARAGRA
jgi:phage terminase large subunit GpA-like protein